MLTADFSYPLPEHAIAQVPAHPRDSARLLVLDGLFDARITDLPELLERGDRLVVNTTRVRRARLRGTKVPSGGAVEALLLSAEGDGVWRALVRPARRLRRGLIIDFGPANAEVVAGPENGVVKLRFEGQDAETIAADLGEVPLPPYIHHTLDDPERYQTIYADRVGSAAAPTAGLHFTEGLLHALAERGIERSTVDLEVGLATFRPIESERIEEHRMHTERVTVPEGTVAEIGETQAAGGRIIAVGTTVVRALESAAAGGMLAPFAGDTDLYIRPGHEFRVVDGLLTNFHAPRSSLLVLLASFTGPHWISAYETALARGYRFLSFGDAMLVMR